MALENDVFKIGLSCDFILSKRLHFAFLSRGKAPQSYAIPWINYPGEFILKNKSILIQISRLGRSTYEPTETFSSSFYGTTPGVQPLSFTREWREKNRSPHVSMEVVSMNTCYRT